MQNRENVPETAQAFAYEIKGNSAVIWRCFSRDTKAVIPSVIEGYPVTEIAPYAFSAHMDVRTFEKEVRMGKMRFYVPEFLESLPEPLCGDALEEIVFPSTVLRIGRYCFYNCANLRSLEFWSTLFDWGSGIFTGSHKINQMCIHVVPDQPSSFKQVLDEIYEELYVSYIIENGKCQEETERANGVTYSDMTEAGSVDEETKQSSGHIASLVFPEFFVEGIENTPARILEERIHGTGMMYRNCFKGKVFDFRQYDTLLPHAIVHEPARAVGKLVMGRLRYPMELSEKAKEQYTTYVKEHSREMAEWILEERDMDALRWLLSMVEKTEPFIAYVTEQAARLQFTEAMSLLMEAQRESRPKRARRRMEL